MGLDRANGIPWQAIKGRLLVVCASPETEREREVAMLEALHPDWDSDDIAAERKLSPQEKARLERRRQFFGNEYSG